MKNTLRIILSGLLGLFVALVLAQLLYTFTVWDWRLMPISDFEPTERAILFLGSLYFVSVGGILGSKP